MFVFWIDMEIAAMSQGSSFRAGEEAILLQPLHLCSASPRAEIGERVTVILPWPTRDRQPGYRVRYREPGSRRELHVVVPATALAPVPNLHPDPTSTHDAAFVPGVLDR